MRKLWLIMLCTLAFLGTAAVSEAAISVRIFDGTTARDGVTLNGLKLIQAINPPVLNADTTTTLNILACTTPPCTVLFPSGTAFSSGEALPNPLPAGTTFKIQDVSSTNRARIEVLDAATSSDRISFKGVKFTSLVAGKTLTVTYGTTLPAAGTITPTDLRTLSSTQASSYFVSAAFSGFFRTSAGLRATACKAGTVSTDMDDSTDACARLSVTLNGTGVDGQGNSVSATVAVACNNAFPTLNPCGTNGSWTATTGTFTGVNDGKSLSCPSTCAPKQVATLTAKFNGANEVLQLTASLNGVMANQTDENGGVEDATIGLAGEVPLNRWIATSATLERCKAVGKAPTTNDTRNIVSGASLPISFEYWCGQYAPVPSVALVSLADSSLLPGAVSTRYMASRLTFLPEPGSLLFKNVSSLSFTYDVAFGTEATPTDPRLGTLDFADCRDGSLRIEIQLVDSSGVDMGTAKVYLGSSTQDFFKNECNLHENIGLDIVGNPDARVDLSGLVGNLATPCCIAFSAANKGNVGNLRVRRIAFVVGRPLSGVSDPPENYKVTLTNASVNGIPATLQAVTNIVRVTDLSTNGVSITITKLTSPTDVPPDPLPVPRVVKVIPSSQIVINGGKFTSSVNVNEIAAESGASFAISLCPNGTTDNDPNLPANTVLGNCIADNSRFTFQ
jgi:hypothetical protein